MSNNIAQDRTIASCIANGSTNIPLRRTLSKPKINNNISNNNNNNHNNGLPPQSPHSNINKWKTKYEESEQKRKSLLSQNEKSKFLYSRISTSERCLQLILLVSSLLRSPFL